MDAQPLHLYLPSLPLKENHLLLSNSNNTQPHSPCGSPIFLTSYTQQQVLFFSSCLLPASSSMQQQDGFLSPCQTAGGELKLLLYFSPPLLLGPNSEPRQGAATSCSAELGRTVPWTWSSHISHSPRTAQAAARAPSFSSSLESSEAGHERRQ